MILKYSYFPFLGTGGKGRGGEEDTGTKFSHLHFIVMNLHTEQISHHKKGKVLKGG